MDILALKVVANHDEFAARHGAKGGGGGASAWRAEHTMSGGYRNDAIMEAVNNLDDGGNAMLNLILRESMGLELQLMTAVMILMVRG